MSELACRKCGKTLQKPATGRPPDYCSTGCRRAVEYEIRRINRHLERLESDRLQLSDERNLQIMDMQGRTSAEQLADCEAAIVGLEARLRVLLETNAA